MCCGSSLSRGTELVRVCVEDEARSRSRSRSRLTLEVPAFSLLDRCLEDDECSRDEDLASALLSDERVDDDGEVRLLLLLLLLRLLVSAASVSASPSVDVAVAEAVVEAATGRTQVRSLVSGW